MWSLAWRLHPPALPFFSHLIALVFPSILHNPARFQGRGALTADVLVERKYGSVRVNVLTGVVVNGAVVTLLVVGSDHIVMSRMPWLGVAFARSDCGWLESLGANVHPGLFRALCRVGMGKELTPEQQTEAYQLFYDELRPQEQELMTSLEAGGAGRPPKTRCEAMRFLYSKRGGVVSGERRVNVRERGVFFRGRIYSRSRPHFLSLLPFFTQASAAKRSSACCWTSRWRRTRSRSWKKNWLRRARGPP